MAWTLGYRWAPRLADLPDQRLWRIDPKADYGALDWLARNRINTRLIAENWEPNLPPRRIPARPHRHTVGDPADPATVP